MNRDEFWKHIETINRDALSDGDEEVAIKPLQSRLQLLRISELEEFDEHLSQCLYALDGKIFADESGDAGGSDDGFLYARCYVVAQGREQYEATLKNPSLMPKTLDQWCETLLYAHRYAWATLTGNDVSETPFEATVSFESCSNENLWPQ